MDFFKTVQQGIDARRSASTSAHSTPGMRRAVAGLLVSLSLVSGLTAQSAYAGPEDAPSAGAMAADLIVARPIAAAITALGAGAFVVSLPFSALGGNIAQSAERLVLAPGKEAFVRCLGCRSSLRYRRPRD